MGGEVMNRKPLGIEDEDFIRGNIPMTKREVRMAVLAEAALQNDSNVLDIGAGTGSISIEAALQAPSGKVWAIEKESEGIDLIQKNAEKHGVKNIEILAGRAPEMMAEIDHLLDAVIIGGSGGELEAILDRSSDLLKIDGRIVVTAVTTGTVDRAARYFSERKEEYQWWGYQAGYTRLRPVGSHFLFQAQNPVFLVVAKKR